MALRSFQQKKAIRTHQTYVYDTFLISPGQAQKGRIFFNRVSAVSDPIHDFRVDAGIQPYRDVCLSMRLNETYNIAIHCFQIASAVNTNF